jgi:hypothetical protein
MRTTERWKPSADLALGSWVFVLCPVPHGCRTEPEATGGGPAWPPPGAARPSSPPRARYSLSLWLHPETICRSSYLQGSRALSAWRRQPPPTTARVSKSSNRHDACGQNHPFNSPARRRRLRTNGAHMDGWIHEASKETHKKHETVGAPRDTRSRDPSRLR